ncbi:MAG: hypothetical protein N2Z21_10560 [Candidatus Sumerlaeaceae bacterium]|nr:hypothetical protein [Candidatus Sumerlaeaceae bacterium]
MWDNPQREAPELGTSSTAPRKLLPPLKLLPAALLILVSALWLVFQGGSAVVSRLAVGLDHPYFQLDNEEGALLAQVLDLRKGRLPYRPINDYPFIVGTYPPLYLLASSLFTSAEIPSLWGGRLVSAGGLLLTLFALGLASVLAARSFVAPCVAVGLYLATYEVYSWTPYFRVDFLACGLSLAGLAALHCSPARRHAFLAAVLFALAFFTKQTSLSAPVAAYVALLRFDRSAAHRFFLLTLSAIGIPFLILTGLTKGQFFLHTVIYNANQMNWNDLIIWGRHLWRFYPFLLGLIAACLAIATFRKETSTTDNDLLPNNDDSGHHLLSENIGSPTSTAMTVDRNDATAAQARSPQHFTGILVVAYFLTSLINILAIAKSGSAENYLLEPLAAASLFVGVMMARSLKIASTTSGLAYDPIHLMALLLLCHTIAMGNLRPILMSKQPSPEDFKNAALLTQQIRAAKSPVLCELACYTIFAEKDVLFQPFIMSELARQGRWDQEPFLRDLRNKKFSLIATTVDLQNDVYTDAFTLQMREEIRQNYRLVARYESGRLWRHYLYAPVSSPLSAQPGASK